MGRKQKGIFVAAIIAGLVWIGVIGTAVVNSANHPEVSKVGRS